METTQLAEKMAANEAKGGFIEKSHLHYCRCCSRAWYT
jgi:hypothetical protein